MEGGVRIYECLNVVVALVHSAGWRSIMDASPHPGPGEFPNLWPDLRFLGPVLLHFYKAISLTIGPVDGSPPQFKDHLQSDWGHIQSQGANCLQKLLETLDRASLCTLLGGLANRNRHWLGARKRDTEGEREIALWTKREIDRESEMVTKERKRKNPQDTAGYRERVCMTLEE